MEKSLDQREVTQVSEKLCDTVQLLVVDSLIDGAESWQRGFRGVGVRADGRPWKEGESLSAGYTRSGCGLSGSAAAVAARTDGASCTERVRVRKQGKGVGICSGSGSGSGYAGFRQRSGVIPAPRDETTASTSRANGPLVVAADLALPAGLARRLLPIASTGTG